MKKLLSLALFALASIPAFAAFQYTVVSSSGSTPAYSNYQIQITEGSGSIYLGQWSNNASIGSSWITGFGYYTDASQLISGSVVTKADGSASYKLGDFSVGDTVSVWVSTAASTAGTSGDWQGLLYRGKIATPSNTVLYVVSGGYFISFTLEGVEVSARSPNGQPLPSVLVTALLGGGMLLPLRKRLFRKSA